MGACLHQSARFTLDAFGVPVRVAPVSRWGHQTSLQKSAVALRSLLRLFSARNARRFQFDACDAALPARQERDSKAHAVSSVTLGAYLHEAFMIALFESRSHRCVLQCPSTSSSGGGRPDEILFVVPSSGARTLTRRHINTRRPVLRAALPAAESARRRGVPCPSPSRSCVRDRFATRRGFPRSAQQSGPQPEALFRPQIATCARTVSLGESSTQFAHFSMVLHHECDSLSGRRKEMGASTWRIHVNSRSCCSLMCQCFPGYRNACCCGSRGNTLSNGNFSA